jgi:hypothetical protein
MTLQEIREWMKDKKRVDSHYEHDSNGNCEGYDIFEHEGALWQVNFCNEYPSEVWGEKGYIRGLYEPVKVKKNVRMVEDVTYVPVKESQEPPLCPKNPS